MTMRPIPPGLLVVDVSSFQPPLDWQAIARAGVVGAYVRVAEGVTPDLRYQAHVRGASEAGLLVGSYQYCRARHSGAELAQAFLNGVVGQGYTLPHVLDVEDLDGQIRGKLSECIEEWVDAIPASMIYTGPAFWNANLSASVLPEAALPDVAGLPLWLAAYTGRTEWPAMPRGFMRLDLWQFTDSWEYAPGAPRLDCSVFRGSREELAALALDPTASAEDTNP